MTRRRVIVVVTVSRSDWGHLVPVLEAIRASADLELRLVVGGMHLSPRFGRTVDLIEAEGWEPAERVDFLDTEDSPEGIARSTGRGVAAFAGAFARQRPDLVVVLGDRFEMLAAALAALPFALPVAHIHGGETSAGAIDNQLRHAITKLAHVHLTSAPDHARRVEAMGEEGWRVHVVGAPGLDRIRTADLLPRAAVADRLGLPVGARWLAVTYHPVTLEYADTAAHVDALLAALDKVDGAAVLTYPNADTAGRTIIERLEEYATRTPRARLARSLGDRLYLSLLAQVEAMVGNSSSGLIEAPSFGLPVVNIGDRQRGRLRSRNVMDVQPTRAAVERGIRRALDPAFRRSLRRLVNPYGDGGASDRIASRLATVRLDERLLVKVFVDR